MDTTLANNYATRLQTFITTLLTPEAYRQCPVYLVQTHQTPNAVGTNTVRDAQLLTSMTSPYSAYCRHVEVDDIADHIDQHHVKASTLNAIADRIARRYLGMSS